MNPALQEALTSLLIVALNFLVVLAGLGLVKLRQKWDAEVKEFETNAGPGKLYFIQQIIKLAVQAAQQYGITGQIQDTGEAKKAEAIRVAQEWLNAHNISLPVEQVDHLIEAAILKGWQNGATPMTLEATEL